MLDGEETVELPVKQLEGAESEKIGVGPPAKIG